VPRFSLTQIETFHRVARAGSFQAAAAQLNTTQPAVSARIRELERALGVLLFDRSGRQARLTTRGRHLLAHAQRLLAVAGEIQDEVGGTAALSGLVRLGVADTIALTWLPDLLDRLAREAPGLGVELEIDLTVNLSRLLAARAIDLALIVGQPPGPGFTALPLGRVGLAWMASPRLDLPDGPVPAAELARQPIIAHTRGSHQHVMIQRWFREQGAEPERIGFCSSLATIVRLTVAGLGLAVLPVAAMAELSSQPLRVIATERPLPPNDFVVAHAQDAREAPVRLVAGLATRMAAAHPAFGPLG
jgi:DNA-binding transcriptional LysR family regulator